MFSLPRGILISREFKVGEADIIGGTVYTVVLVGLMVEHAMQI
jgi:hypothetical protein